LETNWADRDWDKIWLGEDYGWNGAGADIQTSYGIPVGGTGQFTVHSTAAVPQTNLKSFSFNTIDYWYSYFDGTDDHLDFEGSGTVVPEPLTMMGMFLGLGSVGAYIRRRRRA